MGRRVVILALVAAVAIAAWTLRGRARFGGEGAGGGRFDRAVPVEGERGRIDPHGPASLPPTSSPLRIEARIEDRSASELRLAVDVTSDAPLDSVVVGAARYDDAGTLEPGWSGVVWSGPLAPGVSARVDARIPLGSGSPARVQVAAHATGRNGARLSATSIVRPGETSH